jgi:hypothetical protein
MVAPGTSFGMTEPGAVDVRNFGAKGDGKIKDTKAVQAAIDACVQKGGGGTLPEAARAHQRCSMDGCPCRIDFSRADASLMALRGNATSISFLR